MTRILTALMFCGLVASCGADGEPTKPTVSANSTVSINSKSGLGTSTAIGIHFGN